jgi:hypothetical protein
MLGEKSRPVMAPIERKPLTRLTPTTSFEIVSVNFLAALSFCRIFMDSVELPANLKCGRAPCVCLITH